MAGYETLSVPKSVSYKIEYIAVEIETVLGR